MKNWLKKIAQLSILFVLFITLIFDGAIAYAANEVNKKTNQFHSAVENTNELVFKDVPPSYWAYKDIKRLKRVEDCIWKGRWAVWSRRSLNARTIFVDGRVTARI
ncbi:hypothetical protein ACT7DO_27305 [Bacillus pacificus]